MKVGISESNALILTEGTVFVTGEYSPVGCRGPLDCPDIVSAMDVAGLRKVMVLPCYCTYIRCVVAEEEVMLVCPHWLLSNQCRYFDESFAKVS